MGAERAHLVGNDAGERLLALSGRQRHREEPTEIHRLHVYSPGTMMWAVDVPASMSQIPPCLALSGIPVVAVVAPGRAMVMCARAVAWSAPRICHQMEPYSGLARVPSFSAALSAAWRFARS